MTHKVFFLRKILDIIYECLFSWLFLAFVAVAFFYDEIHAFFIPCILWIYVTSYVVRELSPNVFIILIIQLAALLPFWLLNIEIKFICIFAMISLKLVYDGYKYIKNGKLHEPLEGAPWHVFLFCFVFFLFGCYVKSEELKNASYIILVLLILAYLLRLYVDGLGRYLNATKNVSGLPLKNIVRTNSVIVTLIVLFLAFSIVVGNMYNWKHIFDIVVNGIFSVIEFFALGILFVINIIKKLFGRKYSEEQGESIQADGLISGDFAQSGQYLYELFKLMFLVVVAFFAVRYLLGLVRRLLIRHNRFSDIVEDAPVKTLVRVENSKRKSIFTVLFSPEERARRIYRKHVLGYRYDIKLKDTKSCTDIKNEIFETAGDDISELTELYRDVRYGEENADKNIVKKMTALTVNKNRTDC